MSDNVIFILFALAIGFAVALVTWLVGHAVTKVPEEDRQYKDAPPIGFKVVWWPIQWVGHFVAPLIRPKGREATLTRLRKAGMDYTLSPEQFLAARLVLAAVVAGIFWWIVGSFDLPDSGEPGFSILVYGQAALIGAFCGYIYPVIWLKDQLEKRKRELLKTLPFYLDIITLCVEAGLNLQGAVTQAVAKGPNGVMRQEFQRVLRDVRAGKPRSDSLRAMAERVSEPSVTNFCTAVIQAEAMGMNLGPVLRAQAEQRRSERFIRAEKLAMEAPVKMLFPLIAFIFPCTFIVLFFPIVIKFMQSGI